MKIRSIILKHKLSVVGFVDFLYDYEYEKLKTKIVAKNEEKTLKSKGSMKWYNIENGDFKIIYYDEEKNPDGIEKLATYVQEVKISEHIVQGVDAFKNQSFKQKIYSIVRESLDNYGNNQAEKEAHLNIIRNATSDPKARQYLLNKIYEILLSSSLIKKDDIEAVAEEIYARFYGMGIIQELDDDTEIGEILVNARDFPKFTCSIYYYKQGIKYEYSETFENKDEMMMVFKRAIMFSGEELSAVDSPQVEAERANRDRVTITIPDASENYSMNIRKFTNFTPSAQGMRESGTISKEMEPIIEAIVKGKANIGIGGAMGTGKTSIIQYLLTITHPIQRKTVIASVSEMDIDRVLKGHDIVILKINEDKGLTFSKQIATALRTSADRIIIPESRSDEMKAIYEASLKIKGNMFTSHANTSEEFLTSSANSYLASEKNVQYTFKEAIDKIASNLNVVIIMRAVGNKIRIKSLSEVVVENGTYMGMNDLIVWEFSPENPLEGKYVIKNKMTNNLKGLLNENGVPINALNKL